MISPGCHSCYAMKQAHRFSAPGKPYHGLTKMTKAGPQWTGAIRTVDSALLEPLSWRKPRRIFVNSMSDLFHEDVPFDFIAAVWGVMAASPRHVFQILTKRAERMREVVSSLSIDLVRECTLRRAGRMIGGDWSLPLPNVWLGVSVEDQKHADERIPLLLQTPTAIRFVSAEPLLGPVNLTRVFVREGVTGWGPRTRHVDALTGWESDTPRDARQAREHLATGRSVDWVIAGGESGPRARPAHPDWFRSVRDQCQAAGVPFLFKQWGAWAPDTGDHRGRQPCGLLRRDGVWDSSDAAGTYMRCVGKKAAGRELDGRTWDEFPKRS